jgi:hypothetical protein
MTNGKFQQFSRLIFACLLFFLVGTASAQNARFIHVAPLAETESGTAVEFFLNGQQAISNMTYGTFTGFLPLNMGNLEISVRRSSDDSLLVTKSTVLDNSGSHWIYLLGNGDSRPFELRVFDTTVPFIGGGDVPTYLLNAAIVDGLGPLLLTKADGSSAGVSPGGLLPVDFGQTQYILRQSGYRDYKFTTPDGRINRIDLAPMHLTPPPITDFLQLVIIGDGNHHPLSVLSVPGGLLDLLDPVDHSSLGWWDTPNTAAAEGLLIHALPAQNRVVGTIYSYADDDSGAQAWYTFDGIISHRSAMTEVFASTGGRLGGDEPTTLEPVGTLALDFDDCHSGSAELSLETGTEVHWELARLTSEVECGWDNE